MTTQLIPVFNGTISNETALLCNARDLHDFLGVGKVFAAWITARISEYKLVENQDYVLTISKTGKRQNVLCKDYHLTLDTAKELAMVERNEKGRQIRRYFIECEKQLRQQQSQPLPPARPKMHTITLTDEELCQLCWLWKISGNMQQTARKIYPILAAFESEHASACHDAAFEYVHTIKTVHRALLRVTTHVEFTPRLSTNWRHILPQLRRI
ncbi:TPA: antA/AntB antirepressor family protein [Escherichia coli]|nr:antA/AntB antirepressor family protein [Escherichia coli]